MKVMLKQERETVIRMQLHGTLAAGQWRQVLAEFENLSRKGIHTLIVDMEDVPVVDSLGLAALIAGYRMFGSDGTRFHLENLSHQPQLLLQVTGIDWLTSAV